MSTPVLNSDVYAVAGELTGVRRGALDNRSKLVEATKLASEAVGLQALLAKASNPTHAATLRGIDLKGVTGAVSDAVALTEKPEHGIKLAGIEVGKPMRTESSRHHTLASPEGKPKLVSVPKKNPGLDHNS